MEQQRELVVMGVDLADDERWRRRFAAMERQGFRCIGRVFTIDGLSDVVGDLRPDVVVLGLDGRMPGRAALTQLSRVLDAHRCMQFVLMSSEPAESVSVFAWWAALEQRGCNAVIAGKGPDSQSEARALASALLQIREELVGGE